MLQPGERLDDLLINDLRIIQDASAFCFSLDAVLLAHFATVRRGDRVVDLGTGTGVIPLLLTTREEQREIIGIEVQPEVADRANRSVTLNRLSDRIKVITGDLCVINQVIPGYRAELVTANPPYLPIGTGEPSPRGEMAIARHEVRCSLLDVVKAAAYLLGTAGRFAMVHRPNRLVEILSAMTNLRLEPKRLRLVHPRAGKEPNMVLVEGIKDARPGLQVLPPLFVYENDSFSAELTAIYRRHQ